MFQGLRTIIYNVDNLQAAKEWYSGVLGKQPYFSEPFYVGFNVGGYEVGLDPDMSGISKGNNAIAYFGVPDAPAAYARLLELGAKEYRPIQEVGHGIRVGSVVDPFGNVVGLIENPHFAVEP